MQPKQGWFLVPKEAQLGTQFHGIGFIKVANRRDQTGETPAVDDLWRRQLSTTGCSEEDISSVIILFIQKL
uniref:Uncharacterized protein n=1 Tax=Ascaris lumbricoides TaxID=6252 RepID=A0A0M3I9W7_ASCLU